MVDAPPILSHHQPEQCGGRDAGELDDPLQAQVTAHGLLLPESGDNVPSWRGGWLVTVWLV